MSDDRMREAADLVDQIYSLNETVKDHESSIALLKQDVTRRTDRLRLLVEDTGISEVAGRMARATFGVESVPHVHDWQALYEYIVQTGGFDMLHKRVGLVAWRDRLAAGVNVPGVEQAVIPKVTVKAKRSS